MKWHSYLQGNSIIHKIIFPQAVTKLHVHCGNRRLLVLAEPATNRFPAPHTPAPFLLDTRNISFPLVPTKFQPATFLQACVPRPYKHSFPCVPQTQPISYFLTIKKFGYSANDEVPYYVIFCTLPLLPVRYANHSPYRAI